MLQRAVAGCNARRRLTLLPEALRVDQHFPSFRAKRGAAVCHLGAEDDPDASMPAFPQTLSPSERRRRNRAIAAALVAGQTQKEVAARFGLPTRQIRRAAAETAQIQSEVLDLADAEVLVREGRPDAAAGLGSTRRKAGGRPRQRCGMDRRDPDRGKPRRRHPPDLDPRRTPAVYRCRASAPRGGQARSRRPRQRRDQPRRRASRDRAAPPGAGRPTPPRAARTAPETPSPPRSARRLPTGH